MTTRVVVVMGCAQDRLHLCYALYLPHLSKLVTDHNCDAYRDTVMCHAHLYSQYDLYLSQHCCAAHLRLRFSSHHQTVQTVLYVRYALYLPHPSQLVTIVTQTVTM